MPEPTRQKITFGEMRASGVRGLLIYCSDYQCSHWTAISGDRWPDHVRLSDIEPRFTCQACGIRGADVRPNFHWERERRPLRHDLRSVRKIKCLALAKAPGRLGVCAYSGSQLTNWQGGALSSITRD
jgi:hypothetical protein